MLSLPTPLPAFTARAAHLRIVAALTLVFVLLATLIPAQGRGRRGDLELTGEWSTTRGPMRLGQSGERVTGKLGFGGRVDIGGRLSGRVLDLGEPGAGQLQLSEDGQVLSGEIDGSFFGAYRLAPELPELERGETVRGQSESGLYMHVHAPKNWDGKRPFPCLVLLHGSNMSAEAYVATTVAAWPKLAERYLIVGFDGERLSPNARGGTLAFNYSYVEFSGPDVGDESRSRQSPALVADAMREIQKAWPVESFLVGGHSQGGFLTWVMALHYPELVRGAFPMSCNLLVQCEPDYFDEDKAEKQHEVALAVIHGENDPVVEFSGGEYAYRRMLDGGFPMLRFFTDPHAAHMYARLPVEGAIEWLEEITTDDPSDLVQFANESLRDKPARYRDASAALSRARGLKPGRGASRKIDALSKKVEKAAEAERAPLIKAMAANRDGSWADSFLSFREEFAPTRAARQVLAAYAKLRSKHEGPAERLFRQARGARDAASRKALYAEIVESYYASKWYVHAREWAQ